MNSEASAADPLDQLAESFLARLRAGEHPALSEYEVRHPELAADIRELFPALVVMEQGRKCAEERPTPNPGQMSEKPLPQKLGEYRLLRQIGRGGMGVVYEAWQESLGRHVALKVLPFNTLIQPEHLERFRREARAAARLHHTNIVPVFGVGEDQGIHYYAMQFIHGQGLDAVLEEVRRLRNRKQEGTGHAALATTVAQAIVSGRFADSPKTQHAAAGDVTFLRPGPADSAMPPGSGGEPCPGDGSAASRLNLQGEGRYFVSVASIGQQAAEALEYAHRQGVVHRDVKPSNLLLDTAGRVWISDFGLAKADDSDALTQPGAIPGTLRYMAPERFQGQADARSDVYGLGMTLYELLTLRPAFADANQGALVDQIARQEPPSPRKLSPRIPRDLETIVLKAMAKEPEQRYSTAGELAEDLGCFLADRPIRARRTPWRERAWRWCRRNRLAASLLASVAFLLVTAALGATLAAWWLKEEAEDTRRHLLKTQEAEKEATRQLYRALLDQVRANRRSRRLGQRFDTLSILKRASRMARQLELPEKAFLELRNETIAALALADLRVARTWDESCHGVSFDAAWKLYARTDLQGNVSVRRVADGEQLHRFPTPNSRVAWLRLSPDGRYLGVAYANEQIRVWPLGGKQPALVLDDRAWGVGGFRSDSRQLDSLHFVYQQPGGSITVFDLRAKATIRRLPACPRAHRIAIHPKGGKIALALIGAPREQVRDLETGKLLWQVSVSAGPMPWVAWHPDGQVLAVVAGDRVIRLWDVAANKPTALLEGIKGLGNTVLFNHRGTLLASSGWDGILRLWEVPSGQLLVRTHGVTEAVAFSPDDRFLATRQADGRLRLWEIAPALEYRSLAWDPPGLAPGAVSSDNRLLAVGAQRGADLWDLHTGKRLPRVDGLPGPNHVLLEPSGALITNAPHGVFRWPVQREPGTELLRVGPPQRLSLPGTDHAIARSADGRALAVVNTIHGTVLHADQPDKPIPLGPHADARYVAVSRDGEWVATGGFGHPGGAKVWEARTGTLTKDLPVGPFCQVLFSPDGKRLLTTGGAYPGQIRLWKVGSWTEVPLEQVVSGRNPSFSPGGRILAVEVGTGVIRLLDPKNGKEYARLEDPHQHRAQAPSFTSDGSRLVAPTWDGPSIHVWDLRLIRRRLAEMHLDWDLPAYDAPSPSENGPPLSIQVRKAGP
jgi:serine/threonine protein kinase/WD40 repeat protein